MSLWSVRQQQVGRLRAFLPLGVGVWNYSVHGLLSRRIRNASCSRSQRGTGRSAWVHTAPGPERGPDSRDEKQRMLSSKEKLFMELRSFPDDFGSRSLCPDPGSGSAGAPGWAYLHKPIIVMVMGSMMSAAGGCLLLLRSAGLTEASHSVTSACVSVGLVFVVMGLVWIPILKEKQRRRLYVQPEDE